MNNVKKILVIGAGIAGLTAAETLRRLSFQGEISIISATVYHHGTQKLLLRSPLPSSMS